jgi:protein-glutamine gamma-glutamyltransferase
MQIAKHISPLRTIAKLIFIGIPTIAIFYFLFLHLSNYHSYLKNTSNANTIYAGAGLLAGILFYAFRFRFITTTSILFFGLYTIYKGLDRWGANWGEFDAFFYSTQFMIGSILFGLGWLMGWMFQRVKFGHYIVALLLLLMSMFVIAKTGGFNYEGFTKLFIPSIVYSFYLIFTIESLKNVDETNTSFWKRFTIRLVAFLIIMLVGTNLLVLALRKEIDQKIGESKGSSKEKGSATTNVDKDGKTSTNNAMTLTGSQNKKYNLIFCAHIENYFEGTTTPNPLYLTSYHYTKFDSLTETFERDAKMPFNDEFTPEPGKMPLFSIAQDSSKLLNAKSNKMRRTVDVEIYNVNLSKESFVAPSTAYYVQPMTIEKNFQKSFSSAYRAKSYISSLNSAYFIYNVNNPILAMFQEQRFAELRKAKSYQTVDSNFMKYYTSYPSNENKYLRIKQLSDSLAKGKKTAIDKIIAVRDYFLARNALGEKIFRYTDNPGIPGMPGASKINYFLFESKQGYCAYYSGATFLLLRSMGIPCRVAVGFLTEQRANKNPGWYWYYANQCHAWVEVYFPEYGWIDFDTTTGNDDSRQAPAPDGTPPSPPAKAPLAISGKAVVIDTVKKIITIRPDHITFKDKVYNLHNKDYTIDVAKCMFVKDTTQIKLSNIAKGEDIIAISFDKKLNTLNGTSAEKILNQMKSPIPIDEVIINELSVKNIQKNKTDLAQHYLSAKQILLRIAIVVGALLLFFLLIPSIIKAWLWHKTKTKDPIAKANAAYRFANFYLHQLGYPRSQQTPYEYAKTIDAQMQCGFANFMNSFLKLKYSNASLQEHDKSTIDAFASTIKNNINKKTPAKIYFKKMCNAVTSINYFIQQSSKNL